MSDTLDTLKLILPIIEKTYGRGSMPRALAAHLAEKVEAWDGSDEHRSREDMIRLTCWDWFSGGTTAASAARKVEEALDAR